MSTHASGADDGNPSVLAALAGRLGVSQEDLARDLDALGVSLAAHDTEEGALSHVGRVAWAMTSWQWGDEPSAPVLSDHDTTTDPRPTRDGAHRHRGTGTHDSPHRKEHTMSTHLILIETGYKTASANYKFATLGPMSLDEARTRFEALRSGTDRELPAEDGATVLEVTNTQFVRLRPGRSGTSLDRVTLGQVVSS